MELSHPHERKKTFPLKNLPADVEKIVREEQLRLELNSGIQLKRQEVYYRIVREWHLNKEEKHTKAQ